MLRAKYFIIQTRTEKGVSLIEVLVSLVILSIGLAGAIAMQAKTSKLIGGTLHQSVATALAADAIERIRANPSVASNYVIDFDTNAPTQPLCTIGSECTPNQLADYDLALWLRDVSQALPNGKGRILETTVVGGPLQFEVTVEYTDSRLEEGTAFGNSNAVDAKQIIIESGI